MNIRNSLQRMRGLVAAGLALFLIPFVGLQPFIVSAGARKPSRPIERTQQRTGNEGVRKVAPLPPERGAPALNLPNLDETRQRRQSEPIIPAPIGSTVRARRKSTVPAEGRRSHHVRSRNAASANSSSTTVADPALPQNSAPPFTDDPLKDPTNPESFKVKAVHITELRTAINTVRNRRHLADYSWLRPAASSGAINTNVLISWEPIDEMRTALDQAIGLPPNGYATNLGVGLPILAVHLQELRERVKGILGSSSITDQLVPARLDPFSQSGNQIQARDAEWGLPLVSLPGRAGLDLGISLSYSSMVWTQAGTNISFDDDSGDPSPGFRLGFPIIQGRYTNNLIGRNVYLLITAAGRRIELRRVGATNVYEAGDSSYLQLIDYGGTLLLRTTDGTQMSYAKAGNDWHCTAVEDRNGNLILANYNSFGDITNVTDTLGRVFTFNYDGNGNLQSITQPWTVNGSPQTHTWATFGWGTKTIQTAFTGVDLVGIYSGETIPVLTQVGLPDGSHYDFEYTDRGQVNMIRHYAADGGPGTADDLQLSYVGYDYESPAADCPRISAARVWAANWSDVAGVPHEVPTYFVDNHDGSHQMTTPDGTVYKEWYAAVPAAPAWKHGLVTQTEIKTGSTVQKTTTTSWTQDNEGVDYQMNPRVTQTVVSDGTNTRKTTIDYSNSGYAQYGLPTFVSEYAADATTEIRRTYTDYNLGQAYLDRRIIGLVSMKRLFDVQTSEWMAKTTFAYDQTAVNSQAITAVGHDQTYDSTITVRGNATSASRWDVTNINTTSTTTSMTYDAAGSLLTTTDPSNYTTSIGYADKFSAEGTNLDPARSFSTFAYPTSVTDADGFSSSVWYKYDFAGKTRMQGPPPQNQSNGIIQTFAYDEATRLKQVTTVNTGAYVHYEYGPDYISTFASVNSVATNYWQSDSYTNQFFDGLGRVFAVASNHPGSTGGNKAQYIRYDEMGRAVQQTNPFEIDSGWNPSGDDAAGYQFNVANTFDWKSRPLKNYSMDGTYKEVSYAGCGCAGGEVVTLTDEVGRQQKVSSDVLGRQVKTEVLNWDGSVYSARVLAYNARDQITLARQYQGTEASGLYQEETETYDGYGRLANRLAPIQTTATTYSYYHNNKPQTVTDARGVTTTYNYNNRGLVTGLSSSGSGFATVAICFSYDAAGNRTSMTDDSGSVSYQYDSLSHLISETKQFAGSGVPSGSYGLGYEYNLAGQVKAITDPADSRVDYGLDSVGRLTSVIGSGGNSAPTYASNFAYRAWGVIKDFDFGNGIHQHLSFNASLQNTSLGLSNLSTSGTMSWSYDYYSDGRLKRVIDSAAPTFDRFFDYDHEGRILNALTGSEARGGSTADGPFKQTYGYDVWENTTSRSGRDWSQPITNGGANYSSNRNENWQYDNQGNATGTYDANFSYDAAGRNNYYSANSYVNGTSVLQIAETFNGNSTPSSKTETRIDDPNAPPTVTNAYYLRSTVLGGKVVTELTNSGVKRVGHIYAGGMEIARQDIWSSGSAVSWMSTNPATGSEYSSDASRNVARKELDPLGADVTSSPNSLVVEEPAFYNSKFDQMPLAYEAEPSEEYQQANRDWDALIAFTNENIRQAREAQDKWQKGDRSGALEIIHNNPNIGVESGGESYFGQSASTFLQGQEPRNPQGLTHEQLHQFGQRPTHGVLLGDAAATSVVMGKSGQTYGMTLASVTPWGEDFIAEPSNPYPGVHELGDAMSRYVPALEHSMEIGMAVDMAIIMPLTTIGHVGTTALAIESIDASSDIAVLGSLSETTSFADVEGYNVFRVAEAEYSETGNLRWLQGIANNGQRVIVRPGGLITDFERQVLIERYGFHQVGSRLFPPIP